MIQVELIEVTHLSRKYTGTLGDYHWPGVFPGSAVEEDRQMNPSSTYSFELV